MGVLTRLAGALGYEKREDPSWSLATPYGAGLLAPSGPNTFENLSTYVACISAVADTVASLPMRLYRRTAGGRVEITDTDHPIAALLRNPNVNQSGFDWVRTAIGGVLGHGNHVSVIDTNATGRTVALSPMPWGCVSPLLVNGRLVFDVTDPRDGQRRRYLSHEVLYLRDRADGDGLVGRSRLSRSPMVAQSALSAQTFATKMWENQAAPSGAIEVEGALNQGQFNRLQAQMDQKYVGAENARKVLILDNKTSWKSISVSPEDAELLNSRRFSVEEIARIMGVPCAIIGDYTHNTFASAAQANQWFCTQSIAPMARCIEAAFSRTVLPSDLHVEVDLAGLQRGDFQARWLTWQGAVTAGLLTINEVREMEGFGPKPASGDAGTV